MKRRKKAFRKIGSKSHSSSLVSLAQWYMCLLSWVYLGLAMYGSWILVEYPWLDFSFLYRIDISWIIRFECSFLWFCTRHASIRVYWCWGLSPIFECQTNLNNLGFLSIFFTYNHHWIVGYLHFLDFFLLENKFYVQDRGGCASLLDMVKSCRKFVIIDVLMPILSGLLCQESSSLSRESGTAT